MGNLSPIDEIGCLDTGRVHYVSPVGDNATFRPYRKGYAARTPARALESAKPGDSIFYMPGVYGGSNLLRNQVHHFAHEGYVEIHNNATGLRPAVFDDSNLGANGAVSCMIKGPFKIVHGGSSPGGGDGDAYLTPLLVSNASSNLVVDVDELECAVTGLAQERTGFSVKAGTLNLKCRKAHSPQYDGGAIYAGTVTLNIDELYGSTVGAAGTGEGLEISGGLVKGRVGWCHTGGQQSGGNSALLISNSTGADPEIEDLDIGVLEGLIALRIVGGFEVTRTKLCFLRVTQCKGRVSCESQGDSSMPVVSLDTRRIYDAAGFPVSIVDDVYTGLTLVNTEVVSGGGNREAVSMVGGSRITFRGGCSLIPHGSAADDITADGASTIRIYGFAGGASAGLNGNVTASVGSYTTDAQITET